MKWKTVRLGDAFIIKKGKKVEESEKTPNSIRYIQIDDLRNNHNIKYCTRESNCIIATTKDIIIAWDGANAGTCGFGLDGAIGSTLALLRTDRSDIDTNYAGLFMQTQFDFLRENCTGATVPHINRKVLEDIQIPLPSLPIQKKIVNVLDKVSSLIKMRKEQIAVLDKLAKDTFMDMFGDPFTNPMGWEKKRIDEFATVKTGGTPSRSVPSYWGGTIPWVKTGEIQRNVIMDTEEFITEEAVANSNAKIVPRDTILIAMYGQGKTRGMAAKLGINAAINQACAAILPNDSYNTDYLLFLLFQSYESLRAMGRGGNQPNLNLGMIKSYDVIFPDIVFQNEFSKKYSAIEDQKSRLKASLIELEKTYESIMQKAFNGELFN